MKRDNEDRKTITILKMYLDISVPTQFTRQKKKKKTHHHGMANRRHSKVGHSAPLSASQPVRGEAVCPSTKSVVKMVDYYIQIIVGTTAANIMRPTFDESRFHTAWR